MASKPINIQDNFLNQARKVVNGFQIKGLVRGFDNFTVVIDTLGKQQMIYKHAISTITPTKPLSTGGGDKSAPKETEAEE